MKSRSQPARRSRPAAKTPVPGLVGLDPAWSKLVTAADDSGITRTWHVLDTDTHAPRGTVVCVHGNPNWSYMWREVARSLTEWRVIAVDALNMGFSERTGGQRRLDDHISDLHAVTGALNVEGPVVTVAHDWGGPISLGWAQENADQVQGIVLMNTGVARPESIRVPPLISAARSTLRATCEVTPTFLHGALRMARPQLARDIYRSYTAPYRSAEVRTGIRDFVEDIPILETHPTHETLARVAAGLGRFDATPALLLWGAKDLIFSDAFLDDLMTRLPHADVHRYANAGHQIIEDTDAVEVIARWIETTSTRPFDQGASLPKLAPAQPAPATPASAGVANPTSGTRLWCAIEDRRGDPADAILEMDSNKPGSVARSVSFAELDRQVHATARGLAEAGITSGDRLASLIPPGIDLTVLLYACLRAGVTIVVPDAALGLDGMRKALRAARPDYVIADWRGLLFAKGLGLPAKRLSVDQLSAPLAKVASTIGSLEGLIAQGHNAPLPPEPEPNHPAAIVFTSGSTGPSKGVVYTHEQLEAQRDVLRQAFTVSATDRLVVAFAPFALLAPALGIPAVIPEIDVTSPGKLRARTLAEAAAAIDATAVFASPAVLANIAATAADVDNREALHAIRLVATAGAPVSPQLLAATQPVFPNANLSTPYGMTEVLPVAVASANEIGATDSDPGVCVGAPLPQAEVSIRRIGAPSGTLPIAVEVGTLGEVWIRARHGCSGYDRLWGKHHHAFVDGWHRSGDVGHLDDQGRLWIEGRVDHLIHGASGVLAPVQIELDAESVERVRQAAAVGIGPIGTQQLAVVVSLVPGAKNSRPLADASLTAAVRAAVGIEGAVAAVLVVSHTPVDRRHNSKIDRTRVQKWAEATLAGASRARL